MKLAWVEIGIAGSVLGLALLELYNLRRLRLQREREEREKQASGDSTTPEAKLNEKAGQVTCPPD